MRGKLLGLGAALVAAGTLLVLLGLDVGSWHSALAGGDLRYEARPGAAYPWTAHTVLPFGAGQRLLGIRDDLAYRQGLRLFRLGQPRIAQVRTPALRVRSQAQTVLTRAFRRDGDPVRRSAEANLLGSLFLTGTAGTNDRSARLGFLLGAIANYSAAIKLDPTNDDAKYNLELTLVRQTSPEFTGPGAGTTPGANGRGAGLGKTGHGY